MSIHALHSPNISEAALKAYYESRGPPRHRHSLVEMSEHNAHLVRFLQTRIDWRLCQEVILTVESVINVPTAVATLAAPILPSPPVTPIGRFAPTGRQVPAPMSKIPSHLRPDYRPLSQFVALLVQGAKVRPAVLLHTVIILERLRSKLPRMAIGTMPSSQHRMFLSALMTSSKYLNDCTPKNYHWAIWAGNIFDKEDILEMECQFHAFIDWDLKVTEQQLVDRFYKLIYPPSDRRSRVHPEALKRVQEYVRQTQTVLPLTPITPNNPGPNRPTMAPPQLPAVAVTAPVATEVIDTKPIVVTDASFVLQPVPASRKRGVKSTNASSRMGLSSSQSAPSDMLSLSMPLARSRSSDALLEGANSTSMKVARNFSSNTGTSMTSASVSTSASAISSVGTPGDRVWTNEALGNHTIKSLALRRRGSISVIDGSSHGGLMSKLLGVGRTLSPSRRVGYGTKGGDRKVSTATIIPDEVHIKN